MRIWIDLANSPHVVLFDALVAELERAGDEVILTARDHAQTAELARRRWPDVRLIGGPSPAGRVGKARALGARTRDLASHVRAERPDVALSHGSYAQLVAARFLRLPSVTMMDYEHQPANHLSFRLASRVVVPTAFPERELRRCGARAGKVVRYDGFKEDLYLTGFRADPSVLTELGLDTESVLVVMRPAPDGALYHRDHNMQFERLVDLARSRQGVRTVILPRNEEQRRRYSSFDDVIVPEHAVDSRSLLAFADVAIGAGGTMNRESCLLGTPTYTVFAGRLAAVDAELMRRGLLRDLRGNEVLPVFTKKPSRGAAASEAGRAAIIGAVRRALDEATART